MDKERHRRFRLCLGARNDTDFFVLNRVVVSGKAKINKSGKIYISKYGCFVCNEEHFFVYYANMQANACYLDDYFSSTSTNSARRFVSIEPFS